MSNYRKTMGQAIREMYLINEDNMDLMRKAAGGAMQTVKMKDGKLNVESVELDEAPAKVWHLANKKFNLISDKDGYTLVTQGSGKEKKLKAKTPADATAELVKRGYRESVDLDEKTKWKMGDGRPRGGSHIENVRFWDLPKDQLKYIIKDAGEAMKANPTGRKASSGPGNYADQVNDANTVLGWRKKAGINEEADLDEGQKPYVSSDRDGNHVMSASGKIVKSFKDIDQANAFLKKNYNKLNKEEVELDEENMDLMRKAAKGAAQTLKMKDGKLKMDSFTASGIMQVYDKISFKNKMSMETMINTGSKSNIMKLQDIAMKHSKGGRREELDLDEARQLKDPKKETMVSKDGKVIVIDKKDQDKYLKKGWILAEEADLEEEWTIVMPPAEGGKTVTGLDSMHVMSFIKSKGGHNRDMQSIKKGKSVTFQGKTGAFYKVIKEGLGVAEEADLTEGKMSQLHQHIKDKKSAEEIAKLMKVDVKTIKALMSSYESTDGDTMGENGKYMEMLAAACGGGGAAAMGGQDMEYNPMDEGAAADARRAMKRDKDFSRKDSADDDNDATDDDIKGASKNIIMQLRKVQSLGAGGDPKRRFKVEFGDGKKVEIPVKMAQAVTQKYNAQRRPTDKEKFQARIGKSYKDMLSALKEELQPKKETILERMNRKLKENKNG